MVYRFKELADVALEDKAGFSEIAAFASRHFAQRLYPLVITPTNAARKRVGNECWLENGVKHGENGMMQNPVPDRRFMNMPHLWVADTERKILPMLVLAEFEVAV